MKVIRTGKLAIILKPIAATVPNTRKIKFTREYRTPHVGLFRTSSVLDRKKVSRRNAVDFHVHLTIPDIDCNNH
jgi:hypothetical protein